MIYIDNDTTRSQKIFIPRDVELPVSGITGHTYALQDKSYTITQNGQTSIHPDAEFEGISSGTINVYVSAASGVTFEHLDASENGTYIATGNTAYSGVTVDVDVETPFEEGYTSGKTDGIEYQKSLLTELTATTNGVYSTENGFDTVTVNVDTGSSINNQDKTLVLNREVINSTPMVITADTGYTGIGSLTINSDVHLSEFQSMGQLTTNGVKYLTATNGLYIHEMVVEVQVDQTDAYNSGYTEGIAYQKSLFSSDTITENGSYSYPNGVSSVTVTITGATTMSHVRSTITSDNINGLVNNLTFKYTENGSSYGQKTLTSNTGVIDCEYLPGKYYGLSTSVYPLGYYSDAIINHSGITMWNSTTNVDFTINEITSAHTIVTAETVDGKDTVTIVGRGIYDGQTVYPVGFRGDEVGGNTYKWSIVFDSGITEFWFDDFQNTITKVTLPDCITSVTSMQLNNLERFDASGVTEIGAYAFSSAGSNYPLGLVVNVPNCKTIKNAAFIGSGIQGLVAPNLETLGNNVFQDANDFLSLVLPKLTSLGTQALPPAIYGVYFPSLVNIVSSAVTRYGNIDIANFDSVETIGSYGFSGSFGQGAHSVDIEYHSKQTLEFPSIKTIGANAFAFCNFTAVTLGTSCTTIGNSAFNACSYLTDLYCLATTAPSLGNNVFQNIYTTGIVHVPSGSDYSSWTSALPSTWSIVYDL